LTCTSAPTAGAHRRRRGICGRGNTGQSNVPTPTTVLSQMGRLRDRGKHLGICRTCQQCPRKGRGIPPTQPSCPTPHPCHGLQFHPFPPHFPCDPSIEAMPSSRGGECKGNPFPTV